MKGETIAICFGQFGPYHHARVVALQEAIAGRGGRCIPVQIAATTTTYEWGSGGYVAAEDGRSEMEEGAAGRGGEESGQSSVGGSQEGQGDRRGGISEASVSGGGRKVAEGVQTLCKGSEEGGSPVEVFFKARRLFRDENVGVAFLPSYSPARYFALFLAAKSLGLRTVMMNESHAGTERATGWKKWIKRQIVRRFDAALVGGEPHRRYFASLGIPEEKIFTGYDAVDETFFAQRADEIRSAQRRCNEWLVTGGEREGGVSEDGGGAGSGELGAGRGEGEGESGQSSVGSSQEGQLGGGDRGWGTGERTGCAVTGNGSLVTGGEEIGVSETGVSEGGGEAGSGEEGTGDGGQETGGEEDFRAKHGLPERYFLSLGRFVEKKNLATLVEAYARFASGQSSVDSSQGERRGGVSEAGGEAGSGEVDAFTRDQLLATRYPIPALVFVGSGEEEAALREQARELGLRVVERTGCGVSEAGVSEAGGEAKSGELGAGERMGCAVTGNGSLVTGGEEIGVSEAGGEKAKEEGRRKSVEGGSGAESRDQLPVTRHEENCGAVFFYGFRQIEENAIFYALAEAFVLPSKYEEWGLVVNEAMACSLPVIVSRTAGCAEDLVPAGGQVASREWRVAGEEVGERTECAGDGEIVGMWESGKVMSRQSSVGSSQEGLLGVEGGGEAGSGEEIGVSEGGVSEGGGEAGSGEWGAGSSLERRSNGFVFDPMSVDALAEALGRVARMNEAERRRMGEYSREIVARFSCENFARQAMAAAAAAAAI